MSNRTCFVIMPFSSTSSTHNEIYWNKFYEIVESVMEHLNFSCKRSETGPHNIVKYIIENIHSSDLVIAVLTDLNPNVWYELGIRHSLKNGTIMLIEKGQKIPFDISSYGLIKYEDDIGFSNLLTKEVTSYLLKLNNDLYFDSPVLDTLEMREHKNKLDKMFELILKISKEQNQEQLDNIPTLKTNYNRILWVDDYPSNNTQIIDLYERKNVRFNIAISTAQAMLLFAENKYDLIITDMGRGEESNAGIQLIKELRVQKERKIPPIIVFASTSAISKYGEEAYELGALAVINGFGEVISYISKILNI